MQTPDTPPTVPPLQRLANTAMAACLAGMAV